MHAKCLYHIKLYHHQLKQSNCHCHLHSYKTFYLLSAHTTCACHFLQKPPAPRKVGTPLSALTPAPVNTTMCFDLANSSLNAAMSLLWRPCDRACTNVLHFSICGWRPKLAMGLDPLSHDQRFSQIWWEDSKVVSALLPPPSVIAVGTVFLEVCGMFWTL